MNVHLKPESEEFLREKVAQGVYASPEEALDAAVDALRERDAYAAEVRQAIEVGWAQAERGELIPAEDVFAELERLSQQRRSGG